MTKNDPLSPLEQSIRHMSAQQQLAARSLINLIEMISTSSHRYAEDTAGLTRDAVSLIGEAARTRDPGGLTELQKRWAETCLHYSQSQTRSAMTFVQQCGAQALSATLAAGAKASSSDDDAKAP